ncbi:MAG: molybdopterin molybdotransferase MoeA [Alphaproteobacteria bacterium]
MSLLPVETALARILDGIAALPAEDVPLTDAAGRVLASDLAANRTQPPFAASAMDGYAVRAADVSASAALTLIGTSRAGERFTGHVSVGETVRIFTGAPVPDGADAILIQENAEVDADRVNPRENLTTGAFIRKAGLDFTQGDVLLHAGRILGPRALSLAAAMNHATLPVHKRPDVAILATGDELVPPGGNPGPDQIIASNSIGLATLVAECGGAPRDLGIATDTVEDLSAKIEQAANADILVTIGGASVGDHDLVQSALTGAGMTLDFWQIAMRPGKPLMVGQLDGTIVLGLPGNPVSALVTGLIFLRPLVRAMTGQNPMITPLSGQLAAPLPANDHRQDYLRAQIIGGNSREPHFRIPKLMPASRQDSAMMATLATADALIIRPPHASAAETGDFVDYLLLAR